MANIQKSRKSKEQLVYSFHNIYEIATNQDNHAPTSTYFSLWNHGYYHNDNIIDDLFGYYEEYVSLKNDDIELFLRFMKENPTKHLTKLHCDRISLFIM